MFDDARTTPRALRLPVLGMLAALAVYFGACFTQALGPSIPRWAWAGNWQMFTLRDPGHSDMIGEARIDGAWVPIDLAALFPTQWDSGVRFALSSFRKNATYMKTLAAATCGRHPRHPEAVRFTERRWRKRLGQLDQSPRNATEKPILTWSCDRRVALPEGTRL